MGTVPVHFQTRSLSLFLPRECSGWESRGIAQMGANLEGLEPGCTRWPLWLALVLLCPGPAPQTAWDRLLPDGQACSLLPYVTRLCKGSWPAYIREGRASAQLGRGRLLKGLVSPECPLQGPVPTRGGETYKLWPTLHSSASPLASLLLLLLMLFIVTLFFPRDRGLPALGTVPTSLLTLC